MPQNSPTPAPETPIARSKAPARGKMPSKLVEVEALIARLELMKDPSPAMLANIRSLQKLKRNFEIEFGQDPQCQS